MAGFRYVLTIFYNFILSILYDIIKVLEFFLTVYVSKNIYSFIHVGIVKKYKLSNKAR